MFSGQQQISWHDSNIKAIDKKKESSVSFVVGSVPFLGPAGQGEIFFKVCRLDLLSPAAADIISYSTFFVSGNIFILNGTELRRLLAANLGLASTRKQWRFILRHNRHTFILFIYLSIAHHTEYLVNYTERYLCLSASNRASEAASASQPPASRPSIQSCVASIRELCWARSGISSEYLHKSSSVFSVCISLTIALLSAVANSWNGPCTSAANKQGLQ